jgi:hypothetical protein
MGVSAELEEAIQRMAGQLVVRGGSCVKGQSESGSGSESESGRFVEEWSSWKWLKAHSGLGGLLDEDYEKRSLMRLYRVSDKLMRHRERIEAELFSRLQTLFGLEARVTLYDLTNTCFEGTARGNGSDA